MTHKEGDDEDRSTSVSASSLMRTLSRSSLQEAAIAAAAVAAAVAAQPTDCLTPEEEKPSDIMAYLSSFGGGGAGDVRGASGGAYESGDATFRSTNSAELDCETIQTK